jgi:hypothetical protein
MKKQPKPSPVELFRVDKTTGEKLRVGEVGPSHFKPKEESPIPQEAKREILAGEHPLLHWPGDDPCPVEVGQEIRLTPRVALFIDHIARTRKGKHSARYRVLDERPTLPRRVPAMFEPPELDADGFPVPHTKEAIAAATVDGNYTQSADQAVPGTADEVDVEYRAILSVKSRVKQAEGESEEEQAVKLAKAVNSETKELAKRAARHGIDPTIALAPVARLIAEAHAQISESDEAA